MNSVRLFWTGLIVVSFISASADAKQKTLESRPLKQSSKPRVKSVSLVPSPEVQLQVFAENTSFEAMLSRRESLRRNPASMSAKARVIAVRRDLGLNDRESDEAPQDIVLNEGSSAGLSRGMSLKVFRRVTILDPYKKNKQGILNLEYATIEIQHVEDSLSIARVTDFESMKEGFSIGTRGIMIGDSVGTPD